MSGPEVPVARTRTAVRHALAGYASGSLVLVACSGGADSLALAAATAFVAPRMGLRAGAVTVDHGLQPGSAARATALVELLRGRGLDPVRATRVQVGAQGGPEAAARTARYDALEDAARERGAAAVLLAHSQDDQAETVLLGLARGSGARSLAGMAASVRRSPAGPDYLRPLLDLDRSVLRAACAAQGLVPWDDPHNDDERFTRVRVRHAVLPVLEGELGPGVAAALARTARQLRADADALDDAAAVAEQEVSTPDGLDTAALGALPEAVRTRVLRAAAVRAGSPAGELGWVHVDALDALVVRWHGQGSVDLPGGVEGRRDCDRLLLGRRAHSTTPGPRERAGG